MITQYASISAPLSKADRRRSRRRIISLGLDVSDAQVGSPLLILDVSEAGMQIHTMAKLGIGEKVSVRLPEAGTLEAEIRWRSGNSYGARFANPISQAVISAILLAAPAKPNDDLAPQAAPSVGAPLSDRNETSVLLYGTMAFASLVIVAFLYALWALPVSGF